MKILLHQQGSNEIRRIELARNGQITRFQPVKLDATVLDFAWRHRADKAGPQKATTLPFEPNLSRLACRGQCHLLNNRIEPI
jgi:hypothetical protein